MIFDPKSGDLAEEDPVVVPRVEFYGAVWPEVRRSDVERYRRGENLTVDRKQLVRDWWTEDADKLQTRGFLPTEERILIERFGEDGSPSGKSVPYWTAAVLDCIPTQVVTSDDQNPKRTCLEALSGAFGVVDMGTYASIQSVWWDRLQILENLDPHDPSDGGVSFFDSYNRSRSSSKVRIWTAAVLPRYVLLDLDSYMITGSIVNWFLTLAEAVAPGLNQREIIVSNTMRHEAEINYHVRRGSIDRDAKIDGSLMLPGGH